MREGVLLRLSLAHNSGLGRPRVGLTVLLLLVLLLLVLLVLRAVASSYPGSADRHHARTVPAVRAAMAGAPKLNPDSRTPITAASVNVDAAGAAGERRGTFDVSSAVERSVRRWSRLHSAA
jgi:hypothetical protein